MSQKKKKPGRPKRDSEREYRTRDGLFKQCPCDRKRWSECKHAWHMGFMWKKTPFRFSVTKRANKGWLSKDDAETFRDLYRSQIRGGTFVMDDTMNSGDTRLSFGDVAERYLREYVPFEKGQPGKPRRPGSVTSRTYMVKAIMRVEIPARNGHMVALKNKPMAEITTDDLKAIRTHWPLKTKQGSKGGMTAPDRNLKLLRHIFNWSIDNGIVESSPFTKGHKNVIHFGKEPARTRRLEGDEEARLLSAARTEAANRGQVPWLEHLITAALETACRRGELLTLQWSQVLWPQGKKRGELFLPAEKTKTTRDRWIPITKPLLAILDMRQHGPDGKKLGPDAYVFGNAVGESRKDFKNCWDRVLTLSKITGLHFHDLRREAASRMLDSGVAEIHEISAWLGHDDVNTTARYLRIKRGSLIRVADRIEQRQAEQEQQRKRDEQKAKRRARRRPPTPPSAPSGPAGYTIN